MHSFQCCGRQWRRGECVADVGGGPIQGNLSILSMGGVGGTPLRNTSGVHTEQYRHLKTTKRLPAQSDWKLVYKTRKNVLPRGTAGQSWNHKKGKFRGKLWQCLSDGPAWERWHRDSGLAEPPSPIQRPLPEATWATSSPPPISLNSVQCPGSNLLTDFLPQSGASGGDHAQCGRLVLVLRLESQL